MGQMTPKMGPTVVVAHFVQESAAQAAACSPSVVVVVVVPAVAGGSRRVLLRRRARPVSSGCACLFWSLSVPAAARSRQDPLLRLLWLASFCGDDARGRSCRGP